MRVRRMSSRFHPAIAKPFLRVKRFFVSHEMTLFRKHHTPPVVFVDLKNRVFAIRWYKRVFTSCGCEGKHIRIRLDACIQADT